MPPEQDRRWPWWGQARDAVALVAGLILLGTETYRGTYNLTAMMFAAVCLGIVTSGVLTRVLVNRWENGK